jgi:uncharacterized membrane protein YsdA (DUF1294 family)
MDDKIILLILYGGYLLIMSLVTFYAYGLDKRRAKREGKRIKETSLLLASVLGGAFGGFLAMKLFRHKTSSEHWYFTTLNVLGIFLHVALVVLIVVKL